LMPRADVPLLRAGVPHRATAARVLPNLALETLRADRCRVAGSRVGVLAGPGNNAGDALFAAAALAGRGAAVSVISLIDRTHAEGLAAARRSGAQVVRSEERRVGKEGRGGWARWH